MTTPDTAVDYVLDVIARHRRGEELPGRVDRSRGYRGCDGRVVIGAATGSSYLSRWRERSRQVRVRALLLGGIDCGSLPTPPPQAGEGRTLAGACTEVFEEHQRNAPDQVIANALAPVLSVAGLTTSFMRERQ